MEQFDTDNEDNCNIIIHADRWIGAFLFYVV